MWNIYEWFGPDKQIAWALKKPRSADHQWYSFSTPTVLLIFIHLGGRKRKRRDFFLKGLSEKKTSASIAIEKNMSMIRR